MRRAVETGARRPITTLFLIQSVDGRITTGDLDELDTDLDFRRLHGVKEGLHRYYELEQQIADVSFNSGRVLAKVGANERRWESDEPDQVTFVIVDSQPHLTAGGCEYFARRSRELYLITSNRDHPVFGLTDRYRNVRILLYPDGIDFRDAMARLRREFGIEQLTIQTGGELNAHLLRLGLIDYVSLVVAPCLVGGRDTQSLIGGESLHSQDDLRHLRALRLLGCEPLGDSYLHLRYEVRNDTVLDDAGEVKG
jgi:2,5-diamino-6-(ribosylamino)-4(3H)-pyrimidinone 5'-phosphate reductase